MLRKPSVADVKPIIIFELINPASVDFTDKEKEFIADINTAFTFINHLNFQKAKYACDRMKELRGERAQHEDDDEAWQFVIENRKPIALYSSMLNTIINRQNFVKNVTSNSFVEKLSEEMQKAVRSFKEYAKYAHFTADELAIVAQLIDKILIAIARSQKNKDITSAAAKELFADTEQGIIGQLKQAKLEIKKCIDKHVEVYRQNNGLSNQLSERPSDLTSSDLADSQIKDLLASAVVTSNSAPAHTASTALTASDLANSKINSVLGSAIMPPISRTIETHNDILFGLYRVIENSGNDADKKHLAAIAMDKNMEPDFSCILPVIDPVTLVGTGQIVFQYFLEYPKESDGYTDMISAALRRFSNNEWVKSFWDHVLEPVSSAVGVVVVPVATAVAAVASPVVAAVTEAATPTVNATTNAIIAAGQQVSNAAGVAAEMASPVINVASAAVTNVVVPVAQVAADTVVAIATPVAREAMRLMGHANQFAPPEAPKFENYHAHLESMQAKAAARAEARQKRLADQLANPKQNPITTMSSSAFYEEWRGLSSIQIDSDPSVEVNQQPPVARGKKTARAQQKKVALGLDSSSSSSSVTHPVRRRGAKQDKSKELPSDRELLIPRGQKPISDKRILKAWQNDIETMQAILRDEIHASITSSCFFSASRKIKIVKYNALGAVLAAINSGQTLQQVQALASHYQHKFLVSFGRHSLTKKILNAIAHGYVPQVDSVKKLR